MIWLKNYSLGIKQQSVTNISFYLLQIYYYLFTEHQIHKKFYKVFGYWQQRNSCRYTTHWEKS